jgi:hypothetical protein
VPKLFYETIIETVHASRATISLRGRLVKFFNGKEFLKFLCFMIRNNTVPDQSRVANFLTQKSFNAVVPDTVITFRLSVNPLIKISYVFFQFSVRPEGVAVVVQQV